jgi:hypothetical protein
MQTMYYIGKSGTDGTFSGSVSARDVLGVNFTPDVHAPRREANVPSVTVRSVTRIRLVPD